MGDRMQFCPSAHSRLQQVALYSVSVLWGGNTEFLTLDLKLGGKREKSKKIALQKLLLSLTCSHVLGGSCVSSRRRPTVAQALSMWLCTPVTVTELLPPSPSLLVEENAKASPCACQDPTFPPPLGL